MEGAGAGAAGPVALTCEQLPLPPRVPSASVLVAACLLSAPGHTATPSTAGRLCTEPSSAPVTTQSTSVKCCSPWRGQKVGPLALLPAWSL